jgi:SAM-dependent methyltransferase
LEFERTKEILSRVLPKPPARLIDVGGAAGAYSAWLADQAYDVHLVDLSARLVEEARKRNATLPRPIASLSVADARSLPQPDGSAAAVLELGPLYHLPEQSDRLASPRSARRFASLQHQAVLWWRRLPGLKTTKACPRADSGNGVARRHSMERPSVVLFKSE